jgi:hypothetical protein
MMSTVYHSGKPEARHQSVEAMDETAFGIRNKQGIMQSQNSL